jgi:hypothetical protein
VIKLTVAAALAAASFVPAATAPAQEGSPQGPDPGPPACSVVPTVAGGDAPRAAHVWIQCNFQVSRLTLRTNAPIARVARAPRLYDAEDGETLACARTAHRRARCTGTIGAFTRARVRMRLSRPACEGPLRVRVTASGGLDCGPNDPCPDLGLVARARSEDALGCY